MTTLATIEPVGAAALAYVNRLSDYLFVAARVANDGGRADVLWIPGATRAKRSERPRAQTGDGDRAISARRWTASTSR